MESRHYRREPVLLLLTLAFPVSTGVSSRSSVAALFVVFLVDLVFGNGATSSSGVFSFPLSPLSSEASSATAFLVEAPALLRPVLLDEAGALVAAAAALRPLVALGASTGVFNMGLSSTSSSFTFVLALLLTFAPLSFSGSGSSSSSTVIGLDLVPLRTVDFGSGADAEGSGTGVRAVRVFLSVRVGAGSSTGGGVSVATLRPRRVGLGAGLLGSGGASSSSSTSMLSSSSSEATADGGFGAEFALRYKGSNQSQKRNSSKIVEEETRIFLRILTWSLSVSGSATSDLLVGVSLDAEAVG